MIIMHKENPITGSCSNAQARKSNELSIIHLETVAQAMEGLLEHWTNVPSDEDAALCEDYPFNNSFDDIFAEFVYWKERFVLKSSFKGTSK